MPETIGTSNEYTRFKRALARYNDFHRTWLRVLLKEGESMPAPAFICHEKERWLRQRAWIKNRYGHFPEDLAEE